MYRKSYCTNLSIGVGFSGGGISKMLKFYIKAGLPRSGKNIWKTNFFPGQGKVMEFCRWPENFRKDLESLGKVREFENNWLWPAVVRKFIYMYSVQEGKGSTFS